MVLSSGLPAPVGRVGALGALRGAGGLVVPGALVRRSSREAPFGVSCGGFEWRLVTVSGVIWLRAAFCCSERHSVASRRAAALYVHGTAHVVVREARIIGDYLVVPPWLSAHLPGRLGYIRVHSLWFAVCQRLIVWTVRDA